MTIERNLLRDEIELIWSIDRSEVIDNVYHLEAVHLSCTRPHARVFRPDFATLDPAVPILSALAVAFSQVDLEMPLD